MPDHSEGWVHSLRWTNPYTKPPAGMEIKLAEWSDRSPNSDDFRKVYPDYKLGCGFSHCIDFPIVVSNRKPMSDAAKAQSKERREKTIEMKRIRKHLPLLADQIIKEEGLDWRAEQ